MDGWQPDRFKDLQWAWGTGVRAILLGFCVFAVSSAAALFAVVKLPASYLRDGAPLSLASDRPPVLRWAVLIGRNLLGGVVIVLGVLLSIPGVPGPGLLLVFIGLTFLDFPGKRRLQRKLLERPRVLHAINRLRQRFGKSPVVLADEPAEHDGGGPVERPPAEAAGS